MAKKKELGEYLRQRLLLAHVKGKGYKVISKRHDVPVATVHSVINKHVRLNTVKNISGRGKKHKMSSKLVRKLCQEVNNNPWTRTKALLETLDQAGAKVSRSTIKRVLHRGGLYGCSPSKTLSPWKKHLEARLVTFARGHLKQDPSLWSAILWSDEVKLELFGHRDAMSGGRNMQEACKPKNTVPTIKRGGGNMPWGCFSSSGKGYLKMGSVPTIKHGGGSMLL
ncbi:uncharacterized protein [Diadema antillarum]|uniref:uncharacterized protein n=1 Tax=Diadema antillarum TaxID=105358 RepID=UPI003A8B6334